MPDLWRAWTWTGVNRPNVEVIHATTDDPTARHLSTQLGRTLCGAHVYGTGAPVLRSGDVTCGVCQRIIARRSHPSGVPRSTVGS